MRTETIGGHQIFFCVIVSPFPLRQGVSLNLYWIWLSVSGFFFWANSQIMMLWLIISFEWSAGLDTFLACTFNLICLSLSTFCLRYFTFCYSLAVSMPNWLTAACLLALGISSFSSPLILSFIFFFFSSLSYLFLMPGTLSVHLLPSFWPLSFLLG